MITLDTWASHTIDILQQRIDAMERYRVQAHISPAMGHALERAADNRGVSLNNEVRLRLGLSLLRSPDEAVLIEHVAQALGDGMATEETRQRARAVLSLIPFNRLPSATPIGLTHAT